MPKQGKLRWLQRDVFKQKRRNLVEISMAETVDFITASKEILFLDKTTSMLIVFCMFAK